MLKQSHVPVSETNGIDRLRNDLLGPRRHALLDLAAIEEVGIYLGADADYMRLYDLTPRSYVARGISLAGRTAIECCIDPHARVIAAAVELAFAHIAHTGAPIVCDLFTGSGNLLLHVARQLQAPAVGFENDPVVFDVVQHNYQQLGFAAQLLPYAWEDRLDALPGGDAPIVFLVDPPWGGGFSDTSGLDLRRTEPPATNTLDRLSSWLGARAALFVLKTHVWLDEQGVQALLHCYTLLARGASEEQRTGAGTGYLILAPRQASLM